MVGIATEHCWQLFIFDSLSSVRHQAAISTGRVAMLPLFSCAQVRFGNTETYPDGGHALACGCVECARRTQRPRLHLGASVVHVACRTARQVNAFAVLRLCLAVANRCCIWACEAHWYLHMACHSLACIDPRLSKGLWRTRTPLSASLLLCLEALASHLPSVTSMLPLFSCAQVRFGNTKTYPGGGHALACGCFECARRTQSPRFHLGASLVHGICRTAKHPNGLIVLRLCARAEIAALFGRRHRSSTHIGVGRPRHI